MTISLTIFKHVGDRKTHRRMDFEGMPDFENLLKSQSETEGVKGGPDTVPLISPAVYLPNSTRLNENVMFWGGWAALDVDSLSFPEPAGSEPEMVEILKSVIGEKAPGRRFTCYSTASSTLRQPKFRLVFPLSRPVNAGEFTRFWHALNAETGGLGDPQTKDVSRMFYIPAKYPNAFNFFFTEQTGDVIDPDAVMEKHSGSFEDVRRRVSFMERLPEHLQKKVVEQRKNAMAARGQRVEWSGYRDCPFWPKALAREYASITGTGWYHKLYQIMVSIAGHAAKKGYPITADEITKLVREFDNDTGGWYKNRPLNKEADRALEYIYRNG